MHVAALGYHDCYINGRKVSDMMLGRYTTFEIRVLYDTVDVSMLLNPGQFKNAPLATDNLLEDTDGLRRPPSIHQ